MTVKTLSHRRKNHHKSAMKGSSTLFHRSLMKYGFDAFSWRIIFRSKDPMVLKEKEKGFILELETKHPKGYNLTDGGDGLCGCTEETKRKISRAHKGSKRPPRTEEYLSNLSKGLKRFHNSPKGASFRKKMSINRKKQFEGLSGEILRRKIGKGNKGKKMSEAQKQKLRKSRAAFLESPKGKIYRENLSKHFKGRKLSEETKRKMSLSRMGDKNPKRRKKLVQQNDSLISEAP